jgi:hypothetical protein
VLLQLQSALGVTLLTGDSIGAHAAAMTFGYLVLVAFGFLEWRLLGTRGLPKAGVVQIAALFLGGLVISGGLLAGAAEAAGGIYLVTQLFAVVLFIVRVWPRALRIGWLDAGPARHLGAASLWVVGALVLFMYIVFTFIANPTNPEAVPWNVLIASDHAVYIGVITNIAIALLLGLVGSASAGRAWIGQVTFWAVNLGLAVFVVGLILDTPEIKRIGAPVMGIALLVTLGILAWRAVSTLDATDIEDAGGTRAATGPAPAA